MDDEVGTLTMDRPFVQGQTMRVNGDFQVTVSANDMYLDQAIVDWLDTDEASGQVALLGVPVGSSDEYLLIRGCSLSPKMDANLGGDKAMTPLEFYTAGNELAKLVTIGKALTTPLP
jgi:hypothetical protein